MKDIYIKPREDGQDILLNNGLPQLTGGLDNMVYILLMTGSWWGNNTVNTNSQLSSSIPKIMQSGLLTNKTRLDVIKEAERVLQVMVSEGIADSITVDAEIPNRGTLYLSVKVDEPEQIAGQDFIYALNWDYQREGIINVEPDEPLQLIQSVYVSESGETYISESGEIYLTQAYLK